MDGVIVVDKPEGWTSHDVVGKMRRIANTKKIGHLGTLDPIATGVLPLVIGTGHAPGAVLHAERQNLRRACALRLGHQHLRPRRASRPATRSKSRSMRPHSEPPLEPFRGEFLQTPPPVSAKKVDGQRAYELARQSIAVELEPVKVHVTN